MSELELVEKLLSELGSRGGFDGWWDFIDEDTQEEIKDNLVNIIKEHEA